MQIKNNVRDDKTLQYIKRFVAFLAVATVALVGSTMVFAYGNTKANYTPQYKEAEVVATGYKEIILPNRSAYYVNTQASGEDYVHWQPNYSFVIYDAQASENPTIKTNDEYFNYLDLHQDAFSAQAGDLVHVIVSINVPKSRSSVTIQDELPSYSQLDGKVTLTYIAPANGISGQVDWSGLCDTSAPGSLSQVLPDYQENQGMEFASVIQEGNNLNTELTSFNIEGNSVVLAGTYELRYTVRIQEGYPAEAKSTSRVQVSGMGQNGIKDETFITGLAHFYLK